MTKESMFSLAGKKVVVTGGARGIGKGVAMDMAMMGAEIAIIDRLEKEGAEAAREIAEAHGVKTKAYLCDVSQPEQVAAAMDAAAADFGTLDTLFNNAGICLHKSALEVTPAEWTEIFDTNTHGVFYVAVAFAKKLIAMGRQGSIINTASMSASIVNFPQEQASYNASKAAVVHLTKSLALEWVKHGIRVNCISPGYIFTDLTSGTRADWIEEWVARTPYKRMGKIEELSGAVIYLASDCAAFTSGCEMIIDGCYSCV